MTLTALCRTRKGADVGSQEMCVTAVIESKWYDPRLVWRSAAHHGMTGLSVKHGTIWVPPLVIDNALNQIGLVGDSEKVPMRLSESGWVVWMSPGYITTSCNTDIQNFPFDTQTCSISILTWSYTFREVAVSDNHTVSTGIYQPNGEWDLLSTTSSMELVQQDSNWLCRLSFTLTFKRKYVYLSLLMLLPAILNSILMCAVFFLSFESGEKMGYSLTVLLTYIVLLTLVADSLPSTSTNISMLQIYLTCVMCTGGIATLLTVWTVTVYHTDPERPIPAWVLLVCQRLLTPLTCPGFCFWFRCGCCKGCMKDKNRVASSSGTRSIRVSSVSTGSSVLTSSPEGSLSGDGSSTRSRSSLVNETNKMENGGMAGKPAPDVWPNKGSQTGGDIYGDGHEGMKRSSFQQQLLQERGKLQDGGIGFQARAGGDGGGANGNPFRAWRNDSDEKDDDDRGEMTWQMVAELMDSVFLRLVSFLIGVFTFVLMVYYAATY